MNENFHGVEIGNRIELKLKEFSLKQKDLVKLTGLSKNAISNYISGNRIPDTASIYKLSTVLKTSIEWLLTGDETSLQSEYPKYHISASDDFIFRESCSEFKVENSATPDQQRVITCILKLDAKRLATVEGFVLSQLLEQGKIVGSDEHAATSINDSKSYSSGNESHPEPKVG